MAGTIMTGNKNSVSDKTLTQYALFAGGLDMTNASAENYDPLITGYGRLFMVRKPKFLQKETSYSSDLTVYKHILEYGNTGVSGINDITTETDNMTGGYAGKQVELMTGAKDDTTSFTVKVYEFTGSPIRKINHLWISGVSDLMSGLATYHGTDLPVKQSNHTAEFIYVVTDRSGQNVEYACMFANCFPKSVKEDHFNYDAGTHNLVQLDVEFSCVKYESIAINYYADQLIQKYKILGNHLNFNPGLKGAQVGGVKTDVADPFKPVDSAAGVIASSTNYSYAEDGLTL